jgi:hypothetical protein
MMAFGEEEEVYLTDSRGLCRGGIEDGYFLLELLVGLGYLLQVEMRLLNCALAVELILFGLPGHFEYILFPWAKCEKCCGGRCTSMNIVGAEILTESILEV